MTMATYTETTSAGGTGCSGRCRGCTMLCEVSGIYGWGYTYHCATSNDGYSGPDPDPTEPKEFDIPVNHEELRLLRKEIKRRSLYKNPFNHKPTMIRRVLFSKSGWLTRKGRLRKKGKK